MSVGFSDVYTRAVNSWAASHRVSAVQQLRCVFVAVFLGRIYSDVCELSC